MTQGEWVPKVPTAAMLSALQSDAPYVYRRTADKRAYEVVRLDNADWRECISDQRTVMFVGSEDDAEAELIRLKSLYRYEAMLAAAAPPPAAARGDVRGLVADIAQQTPEKPDYWNSCSQCESNIDRAQAALAAEGVQAGEVEQRARELLAAEWEVEGYPEAAKMLRAGWTLADEDAVAIRAIIAAMSQQPEARGVVDEAMVERATMALLGKSRDTAPGVDWRCDRAWTVNKVRKHMRAALTAALTGERNG